MAKLERIFYDKVDDKTRGNLIDIGRGEITARYLFSNVCDIHPLTGCITVKTESDLSALSETEFLEVIDPLLKENKLYFAIEKYQTPTIISSHKFLGWFYKDKKPFLKA